MSWLGQAIGISSTALNLLNQFVNPPPPPFNNYEVHVETVDGKKYIRKRSLVLWHRTDPTKIGKIEDPPTDDLGAFVATLQQDEEGNNQVFLLNNDPQTNALGAFSATLSDGSSQIQNVTVPAYNPIEPGGVNVSGYFNLFPNGSLTATQQSLTTSMLPFAIETVNNEDVLVSTVLANFNLPNLISTALYVLFIQDGLQVTFTWVVDGNNNIVGYTVNNPTTLLLSVTFNYKVDNPLQSLTVPLSVPAGQVANANLPVTDRPITLANISVTTDNTGPDFLEKLRKDALDKLIKEGRWVQFKGRPKLVRKSTTSF